MQEIPIFSAADAAKVFPKRPQDINKGDCGSAAILAGYGSLGAPLLAVGGCLKAGAGYTQLWFPSTGNSGIDEMRRTVFAAKYPACIVDLYCGEPFSAKSLAFGMGAGVGLPQTEMLAALLSTYGGRLVLDADALNALAAYGKIDALKEKNCPVVITPHPKEFSRLTGLSVQEILKSDAELAGAFAKEYGVVVALKSHRTVVTDGTRAVRIMSGSPALAKGGSGDVLAGFLAGTLARGVPLFEGTAAACYVHGRAGTLAALDLGEYSPDASDIIGYLPAAVKELEAHA